MIEEIKKSISDREIKFRAWNEKTKDMYEDVSFSSFDENYFIEGRCYSDDIQMMQYT